MGAQLITDRGDLLAALNVKSALRTADVHVPSLGITVQVRELTARQRLELSLLAVDEQGRPRPGTLPDMLLKAAQYGLGLLDQDLATLDMQGDLVQLVSAKVFELSNFAGTVAQEKKD